MITFDGIRSLQHKWFGEKLLRVIKDVGVSTKTILYNGHRIRVWRDGELSGGRVVAPEGIAVICAKKTQILVCRADFWMGPCSQAKRLSAIDIPVLPGLAQPGIRVPSLGVADTSVLAPPTSTDLLCVVPSLLPLDGLERIFRTVAVRRGAASIVAEANKSFFSGDGSETSRWCFFLESDASTLANQTVHVLPSDCFRAVRVDGGLTYAKAASNNIVLATAWGTDVHWDEDRWQSRDIGSHDAWFDLPTGLKYNLEVNRGGGKIGNYAFATNASDSIHLLTAITCNIRFGSIPTGDNFFLLPNGSSNPSKNEWKLFYTWYDAPTDLLITLDGYAAEDAVYTVNARQFLLTLHELSGGQVITSGADLDINDPSIVIDWEKAAKMLSFFFPFPNTTNITPHDSVMFHRGTGYIYSWAREYGAVRFSRTGIDVVELILPLEVTSTEGVRPVITHAGNDEYICVCYNVNIGISAIYRGSPFSGWSPVPMPPRELTYARPAHATADRVVVVGVVKDNEYENPQTGVIETVYRLAVLDTKDGNTEWKMLGKVPVEIENGDTFDLCFFGAGEYVKLMCEYPSPPPATQQAIYMANYANYPGL